MKKNILPALAGLLLLPLTSCGAATWTYSSRSYEAEEWELKVNQPTNELASDFAWGADVSSLAEVEKYGGKYYNKAGEQQDLFEILADGGTNYVRLRLWNDPYDKNGNPYGGGTNDLKTDIALAKRAQAAGLQVLVDFHYSDSWVDPSKYWCPKAWKEFTDFEQKSEALAEFTRLALQAFKDEGILVSAVQIGNEINPGIAGVGSNNYQRISALLASGRNAAKVVYPDIKTIFHYTNVSTPAQILKWVATLQKYDALPDVFGFSYYPFWHGSLDNLSNLLNTVATNYNTEVMVVETSWGFTDESHPNASNQFDSSTLGVAGGYGTSPQAQATELADIVDVLSKVPNKKGTGIFYWEPAWLPVAGAGWITKEGMYYNETGKDWTDVMTAEQLAAKYYGNPFHNSWANQAWFDYEGKVLPSAYTYRHIIVGDHQEAETMAELLTPEFDATINLGQEGWTLPQTTGCKTNLDAYRQAKITWDEEDAAKVTGLGKYVLHGTAAGKPVVCNLTAMVSSVKDADFEAQGCGNGQEKKLIEPWKVVSTNGYKSDILDAHIEYKNEMGEGHGAYLHWYSSSGLEFDLSQDIGEVPAGEYDFGFELMSSWYDAGGTEGKVEKATLYYKIGDDVVSHDIQTEFAGYGVGVHTVAFPKITLTEKAHVTIGFTCKATGGSWGHADNFYFSATIPE